MGGWLKRGDRAAAACKHMIHTLEGGPSSRAASNFAIPCTAVSHLGTSNKTVVQCSVLRKGLSSAWSKGVLLRAWKSPFSNKVGANVRKTSQYSTLDQTQVSYIPFHPVLGTILYCCNTCTTYNIHVRPQFQQRNSSIPGAFTICVWNGRFCFPAINLSTRGGLKCIEKCNISTWLWALSWAAEFDGLTKTCKNWLWLNKQILRLDNCL